MLGVVGADSYGDFLLRDYARYDVDTSRMVRDGVNSFSLVLSDEVTHGRNIIGRPGTTRRYALEDIDEDFVPAAPRAAPGERRPRLPPAGGHHAGERRHRLLRRRRLFRRDAGHAARDRRVHRLGILLHTSSLGRARSTRKTSARSARAGRRSWSSPWATRAPVVAWEDGWLVRARVSRSRSWTRSARVTSTTAAISSP